MPRLLRSRARRRALVGHRRDQCPRGPLEAEALSDLRRHSLELRAEPGPLHGRAAALRRRDDDLHHVDGDREADALRTARAREDRRVDADEPARPVDQRASRIARIDRRVSLDEELIVGDADLRAGRRPAPPRPPPSRADRPGSGCLGRSPRGRRTRHPSPRVPRGSAVRWPALGSPSGLASTPGGAPAPAAGKGWVARGVGSTL